MKCWLVLIAIFCLSAPGLQAQTRRELNKERTRLKTEHKKEQKAQRVLRESGSPLLLSNKLAAYTTPTSLLSPYGALLPIGLSYYFGNRFAFNSDIAIPLKFTIKTWNGYKKTIISDIVLRGDLKMFLHIKHTYRYFLGLESIYRSQHFTTPKRGSLYYNNGTWYSTGPLDMHKRSIAFAGLFGKEIKITSELFLEAKIGLGLRFVSVKHNFTPHGFAYSEEFHKLVGIPNEDMIGDQNYVIYVPAGIGIKYLFN